ncbi:hypothetical protein PYCCODRAFT_699482 [Trametes coccinea BRFM310]|uniref:Uncharacterized protein n=1 Tax=Trametes coccinea (strain BRFM310) TaxID=1353009 RepID=A0A1Y2IK94_TRAC3|nr:hypothetical protein PYCCODRAFT_699482 [Trametes coccinea BRFM310]
MSTRRLARALASNHRLESDHVVDLTDLVLSDYMPLHITSDCPGPAHQASVMPRSIVGAILAVQVQQLNVLGPQAQRSLLVASQNRSHPSGFPMMRMMHVCNTVYILPSFLPGLRRRPANASPVIVNARQCRGRALRVLCRFGDSHLRTPPSFSPHARGRVEC